MHVQLYLPELFWQSGWLQGRRPKDIAPSRKWRTVADALQNNNWIREIRNNPALSITHFIEFVQLWELVQPTMLQNGAHDTIKWKLSATGEYSTASSYKAHFIGSTTAPNLPSIWRTWAPLKCKFFAWLILQQIG